VNRPNRQLTETPRIQEIELSYRETVNANNVVSTEVAPNYGPADQHRVIEIPQSRPIESSIRETVNTNNVDGIETLPEYRPERLPHYVNSEMSLDLGR
jgi:hypothetical protein